MARNVQNTWNVRALDRRLPIEHVMEHLQEWVPAHDNMDLFWWPFCDQFWVKRWDRTETEITAYLLVQSHPVDSVSFKRQG